ncbi:MAG: branched-chain amino acid ABC transporter permease [Burkholderiales bacterium]|nr:branched-chain amino acid ABC transporter permease [Burkholderiales bacterium]
MRFYFKTDYAQDVRLFQDGVQVFWYVALAAALLALPVLLPEYLIGQMVFILIYCIIGAGMMLLIGYTGQISLGHAAFLAVGAYTEALLQARGVPFAVSLSAAALLSGVAGFIIGMPALRLKGIYLAIATMAFGFIVEEVITRWEHVTGGNSGKQLKQIDFFGIAIDNDARFYYLCLGLVAVIFLGMINLMRSPTGRAFVAIRDSEISAQSMGIHLARYKTISFAISAALTGVAGALYAHKVQFISPEQFNLLVSIEMATLVFIGGLGSFHGAVFGAAFIIALPQVIVFMKDYLPTAIAQQTGLQPTIFGLILIAFLIFEPLGIYGRWVKIRTYFSLFPFYRGGMFRRQKAYMKSDRLK